MDITPSDSVTFQRHFAILLLMDAPKKQKRQMNRQYLWRIMHDGQGRAGHIFNFCLVILILLSVAILPLELLPHYERFDQLILGIESVIVGFFTVEYILRVYAAPRRLRYIFSFFGIVDLLSIMPFYTGIFGTEYIRALRLIRFFKLTEIEAAAQKDEVAMLQKDLRLFENEMVEYVVTKSPIVLILGTIPPIIALSFGLGILLSFTGPVSITASITLFLFALIFLWKAWLDFGYDVIFVTNVRLIFQNQHLVGRSFNQINYNAVTNVKPYYPSILSYIFRYGSLIIDTAAENPGQMKLDMVRRHEEAAHSIMQKCFIKAKGSKE